MSHPRPLFPPELIAADAAGALPDGFAVRPLSSDDYARGFFDCLRALTWVGEPTEPEFAGRFAEMAAAAGTYYFAVIEHAGRVVGTGCLVVERKFIHNRALCGHVEEIAIAPEHRGRGLGLGMMRALDSVAASVGCAKSVLSCGPRNEPFYVRCGYRNTGIEMTRRFGEAGEGEGEGEGEGSRQDAIQVPICSNGDAALFR